MPCEIDGNIIKFQEDNDTVNIIDKEKKLYQRINNDYTLEIDFQKYLFSLKLKDEDLKTQEVKINCEFIESDGLILIYKLDKEEKKIIVKIK